MTTHKLTTDSSDPRLGHGSDSQPISQHAAYLVLSAEERAKGFIRPVRTTYRHVGPERKYPLRDLTSEEKKEYQDEGWVKFEAYPSGSPVIGRFWTQRELDVCDGVTTMNITIAETYSRNPKFYGSTYCVKCCMHRPVEEFVWEGTEERVGS